MKRSVVRIRPVALFAFGPFDKRQFPPYYLSYYVIQGGADTDILLSLQEPTHTHVI